MRGSVCDCVWFVCELYERECGMCGLVYRDTDHRICPDIGQSVYANLIKAIVDE